MFVTLSMPSHLEMAPQLVGCRLGLRIAGGNRAAPPAESWLCWDSALAGRASDIPGGGRCHFCSHLNPRGPTSPRLPEEQREPFADAVVAGVSLPPTT